MLTCDYYIINIASVLSLNRNGGKKKLNRTRLNPPSLSPSLSLSPPPSLSPSLSLTHTQFFLFLCSSLFSISFPGAFKHQRRRVVFDVRWGWNQMDGNPNRRGSDRGAVSTEVCLTLKRPRKGSSNPDCLRCCFLVFSYPDLLIKAFSSTSLLLNWALYLMGPQKKGGSNSYHWCSSRYIFGRKKYRLSSVFIKKNNCLKVALEYDSWVGYRLLICLLNNGRECKMNQ